MKKDDPVVATMRIAAFLLSWLSVLHIRDGWGYWIMGMSAMLLWISLIFEQADHEPWNGDSK